jgi:localization factor PodJL
MQSQANESLSPVQKAIGMLAARLESLEDITPPPGRTSAEALASELAQAESDFTHLGDDPDADIPFNSFEESGPFDSFEELEGFPEFGELTSAEHADESFDPSAEAPETIPETDLEDDTVAVEAEGAHAEALEEDDDKAAEFEAGIESWGDTEDDAVIDEAAQEFEDDFDAIRAAVEGLSFATQDSDPFDDLVEESVKADTVQTAELDDSFDPLIAEIDPLDELDEAHTEARESDIFDDEEFEMLDLPLVDEVPRAAPAIEAPAKAAEQESVQLDADTADYLTRARKAAMAASFGKGASASVRSAGRPIVQFTSAGGSGRLPLSAAASAVAIAGVAAGGYLFLRGKQEAPVQPSPASTYVDPGKTDAEATSAATAETADAASDPSTAGMDEELFGDVATTPAQYAPVPPVISVEAAAAAGNSIAQYQLAQDKLTRGEYADGAALIRRAAQKGLPMAQYALAKLHERGTGVPKDLALAREWTEKAARNGNVKAMHDLAVFMAEGEGGEQTYAGAVEWFRKGAEYGVVDSQYNLGVLYEQGLGISPNLTESLFWFDVANRNGDGGAPAKISELIERVSPEAAAQARSRAASWQAAPSNGIANGRFGAQIWNLGNPLQIQAIQKALNALGYNTGTPDGIMGTSTTQAVRDYQSANKLSVTGTVTEELIDALNAGATPEY